MLALLEIDMLGRCALLMYMRSMQCPVVGVRTYYHIQLTVLPLCICIYVQLHAMHANATRPGRPLDQVRGRDKGRMGGTCTHMP
jgi:hypothetical protein